MLTYNPSLTSDRTMRGHLYINEEKGLEINHLNMINLFDTQYINCTNSRIVTLFTLLTTPLKQEIVFSYYHLDVLDCKPDIRKTIGGCNFDGNFNINNNVCRHIIKIDHPEIGLIKYLFDTSDHEIKISIRNYIIKQYPYLKLEQNDHIWIMSIILGSYVGS